MDGRRTTGGGARRVTGWGGVAAVALGTLALLDATTAFILPTTPLPSAPASTPSSSCPPTVSSQQRRLAVARWARAAASSKAAGDGGAEKGKASSSSKKSTSSSGGAKKKPAAAKTKAPAPLPPVPEGEPLYDEALLEGGLAHETRYEGDKKFNLRGQSEDVIAPWSVGGFEIDLPDWRPQPAHAYEVDVPQKVLDSLGKIENMFGASLRLVSTKDGVWRFFYYGNIRNLIGAEAWTKLLLQEDLKIKGVKEVRFETNYVRDWPDDHN